MESLVEWKVRHLKTHADLEVKVGKVDTKIHEIEKDHQDLKGEVVSLRPKKVNKFSVFLATFGLLVTLLGAWWGLSSKLNERPTAAELKEYIQEVPNKTINSKLDDLSQKQNELLILIDRVDGRIKRIEEGLKGK